MKIAEQVTFGGSGLDRAAHLRADGSAVEGLMQSPEARVMAVWRGKPLFFGEELDRVGWLERSHPVLQHAKEPPIFLGLDAEKPRFAVDVSSWEPEELPDTMGAFFDPSQQIHPDIDKIHAFAELRGVMTRLTPRDAELVATGKALLAWHGSHQYCSRCGAKSIPSMQGWQRNCLACNAQHFPRTDPVVIMLITHGNSVLMGRSHPWPEGMYSLLAGFVEPGETIEAAVRREVFEESGVAVGPVSYLSSQPWPFPASLMFGCHGEALSTEIKIDPEEIEDAHWVTREEMMEVFAGNSSDMKPAREGAIAHFLIWNWLKDRLD